ncbi:YczE/YyaS/YitT family protein [Psychromicrobium lacuslunae]|uniref:membrane protein YczE n=1 Tax=Psychromicrobium lacuslunae TaxID=1618207 RepID=UPI0005D33066|nr:membrane protein [Psychromicrobium lacuslunae]
MKTFLTTDRLVIRLIRLFVGLVAYGFAIALMIRGSIGASPWDVFGQGLAHTTGLSFGLCTIIISAGVLLLWIPLRQKPGFGTVANAVLIGVFADAGLALLPRLDNLWAQIGLFLTGLVLLAFATALYVGAKLGPGPRDGLMTGLVRRTGKPVWIIRTGIEIVVVLIGFLLGGVVGPGTVVFALGIGPVTQFAFRCLFVDLRKPAEKLSAQAAESTPSVPTEVA